ncbi:hypothetical protein SAMN05444143_11042 [Flavobacterium succinicans]|uniref:Uncharacterized protein n=1 Tax=Flavobacterium succinicans TaxID=29536 RepID=A0A1I4XZU9_9FLAO|nr:hypothetical protein [Flavobacterium succinicans]SFN31344.1 hypothetical protein SAMN05444143_11042 [Flavobacterium succinicans]
MTSSYSSKTLVCFLLFSFTIIYAKGKIAQPYATQMDRDSLTTPLPKTPYGFRYYTQFPVTKAFQTHNSTSLKSNNSHRRGKGKAALTAL